MSRMPPPPPVRPLDEHELAEMGAKNPDKLFMIAFMLRPHVAAFAIELEHTHFAPGTMKNVLFRLYMIRWPEDEPEHNYAVYQIPGWCRPLAEQLLAKHQLRLADSLPTMLLPSGGVLRFPMRDSPNIWTIENLGAGVLFSRPVK